MAAKYAFPLCVAAILDSGLADVHADDDYALCWACKRGSFDVVQLLLTRGANLAARGKTKTKLTPF